MTLHGQFSRVMARLDQIGFDVRQSHFSLYYVLVAIAVGIALFIAARTLNFLIHQAFARMRRLEPAQRALGETISAIAVWLLAILIGVDVLGIRLTALTIFSGAFGLAVGFGLQKAFGNLIAGIILLMDGSIKPGDVIAVSAGPGVQKVGQVKKIGFRAVSVITRDKIEYLIPNENLMTSQVENWSFSSRDVRVKVPVSVAYGTDIDVAERLMLQAAAESARVLKRPPPSVWLTAFGDNAIQFEIQIWIDDPEDGIGNVRSDVLKRLWHLFREHGVEIPYPQRDIHVKEWPANAPRPGEERKA